MFPKARFKLPNGDLLTVWLTPKYVLFVVVQPGRQPFRTEIYVPWKQMLKLLPWLVKGAKTIRSGSDYPPALMQRYLEVEASIEDDLRRQKRERRGASRRRAR